jgi:hypothetical protein
MTDQGYIKIPKPNLKALTLPGLKVYLLAAAGVAYALYAYHSGDASATQTATALFAGGLGAALRAAIGKMIAFATTHATQLAELKALLQAVLAQYNAQQPTALAVSPPAFSPAAPQPPAAAPSAKA